MINTVPNQIIVIVNKEKADKIHPYSCINLEASNYAAIHCDTVGSFKLWYYMASNQNQYEFALSRVAFCMWSGLSKDAYLAAVKKLKEQGFLVPVPGCKNKYTFYELPTTETIPETKEDLEIQIPEEKVEEIYNIYNFQF